MVTASARTNAIGHNVSGLDSWIGNLVCKTDHFKICRADGGDSVFRDGGDFILSRHALLGDILSDPVDDIQIIGQHMFENGTRLTQKIELWLFVDSKKNCWEVRANDRRLMCLMKRVYARQIKKGSD